MTESLELAERLLQVLKAWVEDDLKQGDEGDQSHKGIKITA